MKKKIITISRAICIIFTIGNVHSYPEKPVKFIIPSVPGGVSDAVGRVYAEEVGKILKQPIVPENVPGGGTLLAIKRTLGAPADGYTVPIFANTIVTMPYVDKNAGFKSSDFTGVSYLSKMPLALVVGNSSKFKNITELVAYAKKNPGLITFSSVGIGTTSHLPVELFAQSAGVNFNLISYKGSAQAIPDVVSGRVNFMMGNAATVAELIKGGKVRALATTSPQRTEHFPDVPTFSELGYPEVVYELILGLMVKSGTDPAVIKTLANAVEKAKLNEGLRKRLKELGQDLPAENTPEKFNSFLVNEEKVMSKIVRDAKIVIN